MPLKLENVTALANCQFLWRLYGRLRGINNMNETFFLLLKALPGGCAPLHAGRLAAGVRPVGPGHERPHVRR